MNVADFGFALLEELISQAGTRARWQLPDGDRASERPHHHSTSAISQPHFVPAISVVNDTYSRRG
jgi:hypothetical protein